MHNNHYLLRPLAELLSRHLSGLALTSCFSQEKDEIVLGFHDHQRSFYIRAWMTPAYSFLAFPEVVHRPRKNSIDLFQPWSMGQVTGVRCFDNERSFAIELGGEKMLIFKMHGNQANLIGWDNGVKELFRNTLTRDLQITPSNLHRTIDFTRATFDRLSADEFEKHYFTFGSSVWGYLHEQGFKNANRDRQWELLQQVLKWLQSPSYYLIQNEKEVRLTLLPSDTRARRFGDPIVALNHFVPAFLAHRHLTTSKRQVLQALNGRLSQATKFQQKNQHRLNELHDDHHLQQWADLIMAHMHAIDPEAKATTLPSFEDPAVQITIPLKPGLSPQKNAEIYYRKARNRHQETEQLNQRLERATHQIAELNQLIAIVENAQDQASLQEASDYLQRASIEKETDTLPYREVVYEGWRIWIGKHAEANDELTLHYAYKEDMWLHARDVAGSHVIVKHQSGKNFPKSVLEKAASLAAYYSKSRTESLAAVSCTPKKYVRKRKGDPAGMVVVEREKVLLVEPGDS